MREKITQQYEDMTNMDELATADNVKGLIGIQEKVSFQFLSIINSALSHKDTRVDIIKLYAEVFHEQIISALKQYFKRNQKSLENLDLFEIIKFLFVYRARLRLFGDALNDKRINDGITVLCRTVGRRILKNNMKSVETIIRRETEKQPEVDARGKLVTTAPNDVFKITNETFNVLSYCPCVDLNYALLEACAQTIQYIQSGLVSMLRVLPLSVEKYCAFCNNIPTYLNSCKDFMKQAEILAQSDRDTITKVR